LGGVSAEGCNRGIAVALGGVPDDCNLAFASAPWDGVAIADADDAQSLADTNSDAASDLDTNADTDCAGHIAYAGPDVTSRACAGPDVAAGSRACAGPDVATSCTCAGPDVTSCTCAGPDVVTRTRAGTDVVTRTRAGTDFDAVTGGNAVAGAGEPHQLRSLTPTF
ncbi:MAG: hypothetical protein ABWY04_21370, partial [Arthrobacter sp.]